jgi:hypothetical protein
VSRRFIDLGGQDAPLVFPVGKGLGARDEARSDPCGFGPKRQRRSQSPAVGDPLGGNHRNGAGGIDQHGQKREGRCDRPIGTARLGTLGNQRIGASAQRGFAFFDAADLNPNPAPRIAQARQPLSGRLIPEEHHHGNLLRSADIDVLRCGKPGNPERMLGRRPDLPEGASNSYCSVVRVFSTLRSLLRCAQRTGFANMPRPDPILELPYWHCALS